MLNETHIAVALASDSGLSETARRHLLYVYRNGVEGARLASSERLMKFMHDNPSATRQGVAGCLEGKWLETFESGEGKPAFLSTLGKLYRHYERPSAYLQDGCMITDVDGLTYLWLQHEAYLQVEGELWRQTAEPDDDDITRIAYQGLTLWSRENERRLHITRTGR